MDPLYQLAHAFIHDQSDANAIALVKWCQEEGGCLTGSYATNFLEEADVIDAVNDDTYRTLMHSELKAMAAAIGQSDTEYGTFWTIIKEYYYDVINPR